MQACITLENLNDVEAQIGVLGQKKAKLAGIESDFNLKIQKLKAEFDAATNNLDMEIETIETAIEEYVKNHMDEFRSGKKKSREFKTGTITTKETDTFDYPPDDELIRRLRLHGFESFIRTDESAMKDLIKKQAEQNKTMFSLLGIVTGKQTTVKIKTV
jgi:phage host-nuclease inhibitor protein Gam